MSTTPSVVVCFDSKVFDLDTIKRAAYRFSDRCSFDFRPTAEGTACTLAFLKDAAPDAVAALVQSFKIEVLDQDLRKSIAEETAPMRNAILAYTFSKTGFQSDG
jgi:His-Xaa-Ser system protein HxsD